MNDHIMIERSDGAGNIITGYAEKIDDQTGAMADSITELLFDFFCQNEDAAFADVYVHYEDIPENCPRRYSNFSRITVSRDDVIDHDYDDDDDE
jgi:hypothetical protein